MWLGYDQSNWLPGLTTILTHTFGQGAESNFDKSSGVAVISEGVFDNGLYLDYLFKF